MRTLQPYLVNGPRKQGGSAVLINRVEPRAPNAKGSKQMAKRKRRKLYGAAAAAHAKKVGRKNPHRRTKRRKARKAARRYRRNPPAVAAVRHRRKRHMVTRHHRSGGRVSSYRRGGASVKSHWSNPLGLGRSGQVAMEGLMGAGVILGTLFVVGFANKQLQRFQLTQAGWGNIAGKLALAVAGGTAAHMAARKGTISRATAYAITGAAMTPLLLGALAMVAPQVAGNISLADEDGDLGNVVTHGAVAGNMEAELRAQLEAQLEEEEVETGMV